MSSLRTKKLVSFLLFSIQFVVAYAIFSGGEMLLTKVNESGKHEWTFIIYVMIAILVQIFYCIAVNWMHSKLDLGQPQGLKLAGILLAFIALMSIAGLISSKLVFVSTELAEIIFKVWAFLFYNMIVLAVAGDGPDPGENKVKQEPQKSNASTSLSCLSCSLYSSSYMGSYGQSPEPESKTPRYATKRVVRYRFPSSLGGGGRGGDI